MKLLLVEDHTAPRGSLARQPARCGVACPDAARRDGLHIRRQSREEGLKTAVLVLSARDTGGDRVLRLNAGAHDYLPKLFDLDQLEARFRARYRRHPANNTELAYDPRETSVIRYYKYSKSIYRQDQVWSSRHANWRC